MTKRINIQMDNAAKVALLNFMQEIERISGKEFPKAQKDKIKIGTTWKPKAVLL